MKDKSYLFVPGDRQERFEKAMATNAHVVILDLEDAVAPSAKDAARQSIRHWLQKTTSQETGPRLFLRINDVNTDWYEEDCELLQSPHIAGVMLPKAENVQTVGALAESLNDSQELIPLIETVGGWDAARQIASVKGVSRLAFGSVDFCIDAGIPGEAEHLHFVRTSLVLASRLAGVAPPIDGVTVDFRNEAQLASDVTQSRQFGFGAKLCIHPLQVQTVNEGYSPGSDEIVWAKKVVAAVQTKGAGAIAVDGKLVDKPLLLRAQKILEAAH